MNKQLQNCHEDVREILLLLKQKGFHLAIISNSKPKTINKDLKRFALTNVFDTIILSEKEDVAKQKALAQFLEKTKAEPTACVFIGNDLLEYIAARKKGFVTILEDYTNKYTNTENIFDYRITSLKDLKLLCA